MHVKRFLHKLLSREIDPKYSNLIVVTINLLPPKKLWIKTAYIKLSISSAESYLDLSNAKPFQEKSAHAQLSHFSSTARPPAAPSSAPAPAPGPNKTPGAK